MRTYLAKRLLLIVPTLFGVAAVVFLIMRVIPGDVTLLILGGDQTGRIDPQQLAAMRHQLGLDQPLAVQFGAWLWGVLRLDFGTSLWTGQPVIEEVLIRLPLSLEVAILATIVSVLLAVPLGMLAAVRQDTWVDYVIRLFSIGGLAMPSFWIGLLMVLATITFFGWAPPLVFTAITEDPIANLSQMILPALSVGYRYSAVSMRMTRSTVLEVLREDYVRTARAKGVSESLVVMRHALRNALLPVITVVSLEFAFLIGGLVVTEQVFNLNGIGKLLVDAVAHRDYTLIQALVLLLAAVFVLINFVVDMVYVVLDPRIRYS